MPSAVLSSHLPHRAAQRRLCQAPASRPKNWLTRLGALALVGLLHALFLTLLLWSAHPGPLPASTVSALEVGWLAAPGNVQTPPGPAAQTKAETRPATREKSAKPEPRPTTAAKLLTTESGPASSNAARPGEGETPASTSTVAPSSASTGSNGGAPAVSGNSGGSEAPGFDAAYLANPAPPYPGLSRELGEEGRVLLRVLVSAEGKVQEIEINRSSGHERLDRAASRAVWNWRFVPGRRDGQPLAAWVIVPINFSLRK